MTTRFRPLLLVLLVAVFLPCASFAGTALKVMTYNVDEGTDFAPLISVLTNPNANLNDFQNAVTAIIAEVQSWNPALRAQLIAGEIANAQPDIVGLQEAAVWTFDGSTIDLRQRILGALAGLGHPYTAVVTVPEFQLSIPQLGVGFMDQEVILVRSDELNNSLVVTGTNQGHYTAQVPLPGFAPLSIPPSSITRGWGYLDARMNGTAFRFLTTHLEDGTNTISPIFALVQALQAIQLVNLPAATGLPMIMAGDFNTVANNPLSSTFLTYLFILGNGFSDA